MDDDDLALTANGMCVCIFCLLNFSQFQFLVVNIDIYILNSSQSHLKSIYTCSVRYVYVYIFICV